MKKKLLATILAAVMALSMTACSKTEPAANSEAADNAVDTACLLYTSRCV